MNRHLEYRTTASEISDGHRIIHRQAFASWKRIAILFACLAVVYLSLANILRWNLGLPSIVFAFVLLLLVAAFIEWLIQYPLLEISARRAAKAGIGCQIVLYWDDKAFVVGIDGQSEYRAPFAMFGAFERQGLSLLLQTHTTQKSAFPLRVFTPEQLDDFEAQLLNNGAKRGLASHSDQSSPISS